jgi:inosine triphosphate pyrophosphatase
MAPSELNFITGNANKLAEVKAILGDTIVLRNQNLDLVEIQGTVEEVSIDKCKRAAEIVRLFFADEVQLLIRCDQIGGPVLTEDTCLCFKAYKELPGPYMYVILEALAWPILMI